MRSSESAAEYSKHEEEYSDSDMYTRDMLDEKDKPILTTEQANWLRKSGRAGGQDTVSGTGRQKV
jgi:hypothetical protein